MSHPPSGGSAQTSAPEVVRALVARGLPPDGGIDVLLAHERRQVLGDVYDALERQAERPASRGSWSQAASLVARMIGRNA